jgi:hypothetical protein
MAPEVQFTNIPERVLDHLLNGGAAQHLHQCAGQCVRISGTLGPLPSSGRDSFDALNAETTLLPFDQEEQK